MNLWPILLVFVLFFLNIPVAFSMIISALVYFVFMCEGVPMDVMTQSLLSTSESFTMLAVPFFITAGCIMGYGGISSSLMDFCEVLTGHFTGGLGHTNVLLSTFMGGISGSSCADCAFESKMLVPEMEKRGYTKGYAAAITAASSCITPIIPPGICLIIYATAASVSIGDMFLAGYIQGILIAISLMITNYIVSKKRGFIASRSHRPTWKEIWPQLKKSVWALILPFGIIMGLRMGIFTPTECGAVTIVYSIVIGKFVYKELKREHIKHIIVDSVSSTANVLLILSAAGLFSQYMVWEQIPQNMASALLNLTSNKYVFIMLVLLFLFILGMFLDAAAALIILPPLLVPAAIALGISPIHLGIVMCLMDTIGGITPPFGVMLFTCMSVTKVKLVDYIKEGWPLIVTVFLICILVALVPGISTFLL